MRAISCLVLALALLPAAACAQAQGWPSRPVRFVVPFPPGGTNDILARVLADRLGRSLGQSFVVDNRSGAGGIIGADAVAKAAPDGYTFLLSSSAPLAVGLKLYDKVPYDVMRDFAPVAMVADSDVAFVVYPGFKAHSVAEVVAYAKANPGALRCAIPALGSMHHLLESLFALRAGIKMNMVPYKGTGPAIVDLMAGNVDVDIENMPAVLPYIRTNRLRALAVASERRAEVLPEIPTLKELGYHDVAASPWFALVAPAATPRDIVNRMNEEVTKLLRDPEMAAVVAKQGANPIVSTVDGTGMLIRKEIEKWAKVVKETGAKLE